LPSQSPVFWVEQKDRYLRQILIRDIEAITGRRLIVYFANRYEAGADIDYRDVSLFGELLSDLKGDPFDLLIETNGGGTDATESIVRLVQNTNSDFRALVANGAKSNGTLLCLAAKTILMGPNSELGPIEPMVGGVPCSTLIQPEVAKQNFVLHKAGEHALRQSTNLARQLLTTGMMAGQAAKVEDAVKHLTSRDTFPSHGSVIDHTAAAGLGLTVTALDGNGDLWKRIWLLYTMYDYDCRKSRFLKVLEGRAISTAIAAPK
jgi:hypothetical protein